MATIQHWWTHLSWAQSSVIVVAIFIAISLWIICDRGP